MMIYDRSKHAADVIV